MKKLAKSVCWFLDKNFSVPVRFLLFFIFMIRFSIIFLMRSRQNVRITVSCFKTSGQNNVNESNSVKFH